MNIKPIIKKICPPFAIRTARTAFNAIQHLPRHIISYPMYLLFGTKGLLLTKNAYLLFDRNAHVFFGYYDISPFNKKGDLVLATKAETKLKSPHDEHNTPLRLGYYKKRKFTDIGTTSCWNWQQGCRYQWLDDEEEIVIFNDYRNGKFCAVTYSLKLNKELDTLPCSIYSIDKQQQTALTIDFSRLHLFRRGYGYSNKYNDKAPIKKPTNDGVWSLDIQTQKKSLILTYEQIVSSAHQETFTDDFHYLNHLCYSPQGGSFLFFHLWQSPGGRRNCRLMVAKRDGSALKPYAEHIRASHYCWLSESQIILTGLDHDNNFQYLLIDIESGDYHTLDQDLLSQDGHPSPIREGTIITDNYPNLYGFQHLNIVDYQSAKQRQIGSFYMPPRYRGELRCDLHPRLNYDNDKVCVDMVYKNRRAMCVLPVEYK